MNTGKKTYSVSKKDLSDYVPSNKNLILNAKDSISIENRKFIPYDKTSVSEHDGKEQCCMNVIIRKNGSVSMSPSLESKGFEIRQKSWDEGEVHKAQYEGHSTSKIKPSLLENLFSMMSIF